MSNVFNEDGIGCFSLRKYLSDQGVVNEDDIRKHLSIVCDVIQNNPSVPLSRYRAKENQKEDT
jgi:hypothetical protein